MNRSKALELLGLKGNPSDEDLKKAYRKKAMKHHPDRDGGDENKFKEIKEAFEFLESEQQDSTDSKSPYWQSESDAIRKYWRDQAAEWDKQQPRHFDVDVEISLSDAFKGCTRKVDLSSMGLPPEKIIIQPGMKPGIQLKTVSGLNGETLVTVDLFLKIDTGESTVIWPTELWLLSGAVEGSGNITERLNVNWLTIMTGGFITVKTLDGTEGTVRIPSGIEAGRRLKAAGKGYWSDGKCSRRGDLFLEIVPVVPKAADLTNYEILEFMSIAKDKHLKKTDNETGSPL